jgi:hypothetical protein
MTITAKIFGNLQSGVSKVDDLRVRTPINAALQWLGEGLVDELNAHFGAVSTSISAINTALSQISQSVSVQIAAALSGTAGEQTYAQGTFTPAIAFGGGTTGITYTTQSGNYTRIGRVVVFDIVVTLSAKGSSTGSAQITGLPIAAAGEATTAIHVTAMTAGVGDTHLQSVVSGSVIVLRDISGGSQANLTDVDFSNTSSIRISGAYRV